jgi:hypothetical protein
MPLWVDNPKSWIAGAAVSPLKPTAGVNGPRNLFLPAQKAGISGQMPIQQKQRLGENPRAVCAVDRFCPFFRRVASTVTTGHKDHAHGRDGGDKHTVVAAPLGSRLLKNPAPAEAFSMAS